MKSELTPFIVFVTVVAVATATIAWAVPPPLGNLSIIAGDNTTILADNGMTTDNLVVNEDETLPWEHHSPPSTIIEQGSGIETADFIIFHDDEPTKNYYAKSGDNGEIVFGGTVAAAVINDAITSLGATGGAVVLVNGTYEITASVNLASNVALVGQGAGTVLRIPDGHDVDLNVISGSSIDHVLVANLKIDGNKENQTAGVMRGIYFDTVTHSKVVDCWVENTYTGGGGMYLSASSNNTITGNTVRGNAGTGITLFTGSDNNTVTGNTCQGNGSNGITVYTNTGNTVTGNTCQGNTAAGITVYTSTGNTVTGNTCNGNGINGINLYASAHYNTVTGNTCQGNTTNGIQIVSSSASTITGNTCRLNGGVGIFLETSTNNTVTGNTCQGNTLNGISIITASPNNTVSGNTCWWNGGSGIYFGDSDYNTVTGNTCQGNGFHGLILTLGHYNTVTGNTCQGNDSYGIYLDGASHNTVEGNTVEGNSQTTHNTYDGIFVDADSNYNNIQGNTVRQGIGDNKQRYGISINAATCDNNLVINNDLYQAGETGDYNDAGTETSYHNNRTTAGWVPGV